MFPPPVPKHGSKHVSNRIIDNPPRGAAFSAPTSALRWRRWAFTRDLRREDGTHAVSALLLPINTQHLRLVWETKHPVAFHTSFPAKRASSTRPCGGTYVPRHARVRVWCDGHKSYWYLSCRESTNTAPRVYRRRPNHGGELRTL